jgi:photosystem II stability/assembly factor-like uncharacterized protein
MAAGAGATLLRSGDGGVTWSTLRYAADDYLTSVRFLDAQHGWALGYSPAELFLRTTDGGATWNAWSTGGLRSLSVDFADANNGWAVGGTILRSTDGGATWVPQTSPVTGTYLSSLTAVDAQTAWAAGWGPSGGVVLYTSDGGATWSRQPTGTSNGINSIVSLDARTAWAVGDRGTVLRYVPSYPARAYAPVLSKNQSAEW